MRVGIVIPAYNVAPYLGDALRSVLAQSWVDWRAVVVDDGSADDTFQIAAGFDDRRLTVVSQPNAGVSAARNHGAARLDVDAVLFLDADDWLAPDALTVLTRALATAPMALAAAGRSRRSKAAAPSWLDDNGLAPRLTRATQTAGEPAQAPRQAVVGLSQARARGPTIIGVPARDLLPALLIRNPFTNGGQVLIRAAAFRGIGGFRTDLRFGEDWECWVRLALRGHFAMIPDLVCQVRERPGSAYDRMATDPAMFGPCMQAVFGNSDLLARFGADRLARDHRRAEAENHWVIGRELLRHGRVASGRLWLKRSVAVAPTAKRIAMLAACYMLGALPSLPRGRFRRYAN